MEDQEDHFRVYSDRQLEASQFAWNPYMDLMASLSSDSTNHSVSVWRLIDDKQSGSPLLFSEKVPFAPTAVAWVPDKRGLTVGDSAGNVFVFDAERQRTIELQKVHECGISCLHWRDGGFTVSSGSSSSKLPRLLATPVVVGDGTVSTNDPDPVGITNDGLASSGKWTVLSVLGSNGRLQLYYGGSIPIGELSISDLFNGDDSEMTFNRCELSPDLGTLAVLSEPNGRTVYLVNTGILRLRRREIAQLAIAESDIFWLMRELQSSLASLVRTVEPIFDEFHSSFANLVGELDAELVDSIATSADPPPYIKDVISREFTGAKLSKLSKSILGGLDFFTAVLLTRTGVVADHLGLRIAELGELAEARAKFRPLGLESAEPLLEKMKEIRFFLTNLRKSTQTAFVVARVILGWAERCVEQPEAGQRYSAEPAAIARAATALRENGHLLTQLKQLVDFSSVTSLLCDLQILYVYQLSWQRRAIASKFSPLRSFSFPSLAPSSGAADMLWPPSVGPLLLVWAESGELTLVRMEEERVERVGFMAPIGSVWKLPKFYTQDQVCVLLVHEGGPASVCLLTTSGWSDGQTVAPEEYGFSNFFIAQQLPAIFSDPEDMQVSASRGLCSVKAAGRVLTLDLEEEEEGENEGGSETESSASSIAAPVRRRNLRKHDSLLAGFENTDMNASRSSSGKSSPEQVAQRLKFDLAAS